jgi:hypothetical protein
MSRNGLSFRASSISAILATSAAAMAVCTAQGVSAADKLIEVQWSDPEIRNFVATSAPPRSLGPAVDDQLSKLKLPVLAFEGTPGVVENTFRLGPRPATERDVVMDEENPVWYQLVERYGDVTVSVSADLRVQHTFDPDKFPIYENTSRGAAPQAGPVVSVFDDRASGGEEGYLAEYTVTKYGVPYTVTVECTDAAKEECRDTTQIAKDAELLKLIRATPPTP